jgi:DNA-binding NtrC family response regulator
MKTRPRILIVDDGERYAELARGFLRDYDQATRCELPGPCWECEVRRGCALTHAHDWSEAQQALAKHPDVDLVLLDVVFDGLPRERLLMRADGDLEASRRMQGIEILRKLRRTHGTLPVLLMTSSEELAYEDAAEALAVDEFATMAGPDAFDARALGLLIERILARRSIPDEVPGYLWGRSKEMARVHRDAAILARTSLPILILGETGTGKSALAEQVLYPASSRSGPFVTVDLSAIPETLVAAELFGTVRGAFSGAVDRAGCFERADGGVLFLDEIGNLSGEIQRMLLVALQTGRVTRLGDSEARKVDVKLLAATNSDIEEAVRVGRFREDLFARLNPAASLRLVPLRDRADDLKDLASAFVRRAFSQGADQALLSSYLKTAGLPGPERAALSFGGAARDEEVGVRFILSERVFAELRDHPWPGNVRELELLLANATVFSLADALVAAERKRSSAVPRTIPIPAKLVRDLLRPSNARPRAAAASAGRSRSVGVSPKENLAALTREWERQVFEQLFLETGGDFAKMAAMVLAGDPQGNAQRVRLRFNQLGLRVRALRKKSS